MMRIKSFMCPPPGGVFYYEVGGDRVEAKYWHELRPAVVALMKKHGVTGTPELAVAACMCPESPGWYCTEGGRPTVLMHEAQTGARRYFSMPIAPHDEIARRLAICRACPMHRRNLCLTCTGALKWIYSWFGGRRAPLPDDSASGVCLAAKTFESVVASVDGALPEWTGAPSTCWRNQK